MGVSRARARAALTAAVLVSAFGPDTRLLNGRARTGEGGTAQVSGSVTGTVTAEPGLAPSPEVTVTIDAPVCGRTQPDPSLAIGAAGGVASAVVTLSGTRAPARPMAAVANRQCRFEPHVQLADPGATLTIASEDQALHTTHAYDETERTLFNVAMPIPGLKITRPLERARLVRLACDTHPWMRGFIVVTPELAAATDRDGRFAIAGVPPGTYELRVWHARLKGSPQKVTVKADGATDVSVVLMR